MPAIGAVEAAVSIPVTGTAGNQFVSPRDGLIMGFFLCSGTSGLTIYDAATAAQVIAGNLILPTCTPVVGNVYSFRVVVRNGVCVIMPSGTVAAILVL